jgi:hypothetical protein
VGGLFTGEFKSCLKGIAGVGIEAMHSGAPLDEKYSQCVNTLCFAVRGREAEEP